MSPTATALFLQYESLSKDHSQQLSEINNEAWTACKKLLGDRLGYDCKKGPILIRSIDNLTQLVEESSDSIYRRLDLLDVMLEQDLQLFPLRGLTEEVRTELQSICKVVVRHHEKE